jgi:hypothetical protein
MIRFRNSMFDIGVMLMACGLILLILLTIGTNDHDVKYNAVLAFLVLVGMGQCCWIPLFYWLYSGKLKRGQ